MKVGDLVEFSSSFFGKNYKDRNPGLVLEVTVTSIDLYNNVGGTRKSARIFWSDGSITSEHGNFLQKI